MSATRIKQWTHAFKEMLFLTASDKRFLKLNGKTRKSARVTSASSAETRILLQMPEDYFYLILFSSLLRSLRKTLNVQSDWINLDTVYEGEGFKGYLRKLDFFHRRWDKLFQSNGGNVVYRHIYRESDIPPATLSLGRSTFENLKTKEDVLKINHRDITLGDLIYDSYLRYKPAATVNLKDDFLRKLIISAFDHANRQDVFFSKNRYDYLFTSYTSYIHHGLMARSALKHKVKVISFGSYDQMAKELDPAHPSHFKEFYNYQKIFKTLSDKAKEEGIASARNQLETRFMGGVDSSIYYMAKSAYSDQGETGEVFKGVSSKRIIIFLHDFFDSPHIHRYLFYADFHEWVRETIRILEKTGYEIFIKPHPNGVLGNEEIIDELLQEFPKVKLIPKTVSNRTLIREGFSLGLTVYGTLGHEFPYFGIPVLNGGDNPHINYDFCVHPRSREEYEHFLSHPNEIPIPTEADQKKIHEFYYMHNFYPLPGKLEMKDNAFVNGEIRLLHGEEQFRKFLDRYEDPAYRERLDGLLAQSISPWFDR